MKLLLFFIGVTIVVISCNKETLFTTEQPVNKNGVSCAVSMEYEVETVTILRPENPSDLANLSDFDKIEANPKVTRDKVSICLTDNGEFSINLIVKAPLNPYNIPHETLPDDSPELYETNIEEDITRSYDKQGNILDEDATDSEIVESYNQLIDILNQMANYDPLVMQTFIENARADGSLFLETNEGIIGVQINENSKIIELIIDTHRLLLLGIAAYDQNNVIEQRVMLDIEGNYQAPVVKAMLLQEYETSPTSSVRVIRETQMDFDNFQYSNSFL